MNAVRKPGATIGAVASCAGLAIALSAGAAAAQSAPALDPEALYERCMGLARQAPEEAVAIADAWALAGGGNPAEHCMATALFTLGDYAASAGRLDRLAARVEPSQPDLAVELLLQASTAYGLSGQDGDAVATLDRAIVLRPDDGQLLLERARLLGQRGEFPAALADLDRAQELMPQNPDVYLLRAAARRRLGAFDLALSDVETGLSLDPGSPDLLLERGNIRRLLRDPEGARADWRSVIDAAPGSAAARAAETNLSRLNLN